MTHFLNRQSICAPLKRFGFLMAYQNTRCLLFRGSCISVSRSPSYGFFIHSTFECRFSLRGSPRQSPGRQQLTSCVPNSHFWRFLTPILVSSEAAPSGGYPVLTRGVDGVPQALHTGLPTLQDIKSAATSYKIDLPYTTAVAASLIYYILRLS